MDKELDKDLPDVEVKDTVVPEADGKQTEPVLSEDEKVAESKGWQPKEKWLEAGKPEDEWKPAKVFNEIGDLKDKLAEKDRETKKLNKVVQLMKNHHMSVREAAVKEATETLKRERKAALESQDFAKAEEIRDQIDELKTKTDTGRLPAEIEATIKEVDNRPDPSFDAFKERNPWYKADSGKDDKMSRKADSLGYSYKLQNPDWDFKQIIEEVEKDIRRLFPDKFETPRNPVNESGTRSGGGGKDTGKVTLSADEKAVARAFGMTDAEYAKQLESYRGR